MPEFEALVRRAVAAKERSEELSLDSELLRLLARQLRLAWAGDALLVRCAWCERFRLGEYWLRLETVGTQEQRIATRLLATATHGICPECFARQTAPTRRN